MADTLAQIAAVLFIVGSMVSVGLDLTFAELRSALSNLRLVVVTLVLNFVVAPILAILLVWVLRLDPTVSLGLLLIASAGGAPFLPKLLITAKADVATGVGLMVLLMVATVVVLPILLPIFLRGIEVSPWSIARSLVFLMLLPLFLALVARARYGEATAPLRNAATQASSLSLNLLIAYLVIVNFGSMIGLVGSRGLIAAAVLIAGLSAIGYLFGGPTMSLATGQRNIAAAIAVAAQNFGVEMVTYVTVASLVGMFILFGLAGEFGRRSTARAQVQAR